MPVLPAFSKALHHRAILIACLVFSAVPPPTVLAQDIIDLASCPGADPAACVVRLFDGHRLSGAYHWFADSAFSDPLNVIGVHNGELRISGESLGALITDKAYQNYVVLLEYRWGDETFPPRARRAKDAGLFVHSEGIDHSIGSAITLRLRQLGMPRWLPLDAARHRASV